MSIGKGVTRVIESAAGVDLATANGDNLTFAPFKPVNIQRIGFIVDSATASGTDVVVSLEKRPTAGSDTDREVLMTLSPTATVEQGNGVFIDATDRIEINPGEELVLDASTAGAAGSTARLYIEVVEYPFQRTSGDPDDDRLGNMTEES